MPAWVAWSLLVAGASTVMGWLGTSDLTEQMRRQNDIVEAHPPVQPTPEAIKSGMYLMIVGMIMIGLAWVIFSRNRSAASRPATTPPAARAA